MGRQRCCWITALLMLLSMGAARATHIVGGEFRLTHQRGFEWELAMLLYFDDFHGNPGAEDAAVTVGLFERGTHRRVRSVTLNRDRTQQVPYRNIDCVLGGLRTRKIIYRRSITLEPAEFQHPEGYYVAWERCCRNAQITNLEAPSRIGMTFYLEFPAVARNGAAYLNSSPAFSLPYGEYACLGERFTFPFGATDPDGDALRYRLVTPLRGNTSQTFPTQATPRAGPYPEARWVDNYGTERAIPGAPALRIDSLTGLLTVLPTRAGLYVFSIECEERRDGRVIGRVRRDFQLLVTECPRNAAP
ncbi:MAG: gliding motility-associated C-terminal domain-containing protein, partial [Catalinimonas sp.]